MTAVRSILVVEDNPITRKMLRLALVTEGYTVVEAADARAALAAADARAALAAAEKTLPDLVLQDLVLPDMDGLELLRRLRALPRGIELPILALSGFLSRLEEAQTDQEGFTALLVKPIEPSRLIDAIRVYLPQLLALETSLAEGRRLLVVDDDPVQLKLARIHFSQLGFDVSAVGSATDALIAARANRPDVILSDVFMPGTDGFDLCLEIRRDPSLATVPVVLLSAQYGSQADEDLARRVGADTLILHARLRERGSRHPGSAPDSRSDARRTAQRSTRVETRAARDSSTRAPGRCNDRPGAALWDSGGRTFFVERRRERADPEIRSRRGIAGRAGCDAGCGRDLQGRADSEGSHRRAGTASEHWLFRGGAREAAEFLRSWRAARGTRQPWGERPCSVTGHSGRRVAGHPGRRQRRHRSDRTADLGWTRCGRHDHRRHWQRCDQQRLRGICAGHGESGRPVVGAREIRGASDRFGTAIPHVAGERHRLYSPRRASFER
jgi:CheY-like chemotaxis protein